MYAFELQLQMYRESGYRDRDAARCILEKNLAGLEIDRRAAAMAGFALTMKACEADGRFLRRGVTPRVTVLERVEFTDEELGHLPHLSPNKALLDAAAHLDECGSLLQVSSADLDDIERDLALLARGLFFADVAERKLARLRAELAPLAARYDVVVANPPYMESSNMGRWLSGWVREHYPDAKSDWCACLISRAARFADVWGRVAVIGTQPWMLLDNFEWMRKNALGENTLCSITQIGLQRPTTTCTHAFIGK